MTGVQTCALPISAVDVELYETKGTMHGFDIAGKSSITAESMEKRIRFLKRIFSM